MKGKAPLPPQDGNRRSLIVTLIYLALGAVILFLWLFWEALVWWLPW